MSSRRREVLRLVEAGQPVVSRRPATVAVYLDEWLGGTLPARVAVGRLSPETLESYRTLTGLHIAPHLGRLRLDQLTPLILREWITALLAKPRRQPRKARLGQPATEVARRSPRTVTLAHVILRAALNDALRDEVPGLKRNVAELVRPPA